MCNYVMLPISFTDTIKWIDEKTEADCKLINMLIDRYETQTMG